MSSGGEAGVDFLLSGQDDEDEVKYKMKDVGLKKKNQSYRNSKTLNMTPNT